jgi:hypothetical protein
VAIGVGLLSGMAVGWIGPRFGQLSGTLDWQYQKDVAARAVRDLTGVKGVIAGCR